MVCGLIITFFNAACQRTYLRYILELTNDDNLKTDYHDSTRTKIAPVLGIFLLMWLTHRERYIHTQTQRGGGDRSRDRQTDTETHTQNDHYSYISNSHVGTCITSCCSKALLNYFHIKTDKNELKYYCFVIFISFVSYY